MVRDTCIKVLPLGGSLRNFTVYSNLGNGDCLFASLSQALCGNESMIKKIRNDIVDYAALAWESNKSFTFDRDGNMFHELATYAEVMRGVGWGTAFECSCAAKIYERFIIVIDNGEVSSMCYGDPIHKILFLNYSPGQNGFGVRSDSGGHWEYMVYDDMGLPALPPSPLMLVPTEAGELIPVHEIRLNSENTSFFQIVAHVIHRCESFAHVVMKNIACALTVDRTKKRFDVEKRLGKLKGERRSNRRNRIISEEENGKRIQIFLNLMGSNNCSKEIWRWAADYYRVNFIIYQGLNVVFSSGSNYSQSIRLCQGRDQWSYYKSATVTNAVNSQGEGEPHRPGEYNPFPFSPSSQPFLTPVTPPLTPPSDSDSQQQPGSIGSVEQNPPLTPTVNNGQQQPESIGSVEQNPPLNPPPAGQQLPGSIGTVRPPGTCIEVPEHDRIFRGSTRYLPKTHYKTKPSMAVKDRSETSKFVKCGWLFYGESSTDFRPVTLPPLNKPCTHCGALFRTSEFSRNIDLGAMCCNNGKVKLPEGAKFKVPEPAIKTLYDVKDDIIGNDFRQFLVSYNRAFSMAFPQGNIRSVNSRGYESVIVNGELRWVANSYLTNEQRNIAQPGQLYFVEMSGEVAAARLACSSLGVKLKPHLINKLETFLRSQNRLIRTFVTAGNKVREETVRAAAENRPVRDVILAVNPRPAGQTSYRGMWNYYRNYTLDPNFDMPSNEYMGAVFYGELTHGVNFDVRYFIRDRRQGDASDILNRGDKASLDMLMYPLFHLHGEYSWCVKGNRADLEEFPQLSTLRQYYKYRIQIREGEWNPLFHGERLYLQYLITAALRCEYNDIDFHRRPEQQKKYMETYKSVMEYINEHAARQNKVVDLGRVVLLPSRVPHTERNRKNRFLDCMAITTKFHASSYFITMTANPKWTAIQEDLPDIKWCFKPHVVVRVFLQKMAILMHLLVQRQCLGRALAYVCVIEYQKRGLPHCHCILTVHPDDMPMCGREVDMIIRAEIPDKEKEPELHDLICHVNLHHLCHEKKRQGKEVFCMVDGKHCKSKYPKPFSNETVMTGRTVHYRRRDNGVTYKHPKTGEIYTNQQVVPFSPFLSTSLDTNINVELCSQQAQSVKYTSLYLNKSGDQVYTSMAEENLHKDGQRVEWDEIQFYKKMRFLSSMEAVTSIMGTSEIYKSHNVMTLSVHDEGQQSLMWDEDGLEEAIQRGEKTTLTEFFKLNQASDEYRHKMYSEIVETHSWNKKEQCWKPRKLGRGKDKQERFIARLCLIPLSAKHESEYYLRSLLLNVPGPMSFEHIRTVEGTIHPTYKEACMALGLLIDDKEAQRCMDEISLLFDGGSVRRTYALLLVYMRPHDALALWDKYKENMISDYKYKHRHSTHAIDEKVFEDMALHHIDSILQQHNVNLAYFRLPTPSMSEDDIRLHTLVSDLAVEISLADKAEQLTDMTNKIQSNAQQFRAFQTIMSAAQGSGEGGNMFYLKGRGGCGKTFLLNTIILTCEMEGIPVQVSAFTGVAAKLLRSGRTSHRVFGLSVKDSDEQLLGTISSSISLQSKQAQTLREAKIIIWDEISMATSVQLETVNVLLKEIMHSDLPFGGKVFIVSGDFFQCLPVLPGKGRKDIVEASVPSHPLWTEFQLLVLDKNMRLNSDDQDFADWMVSVGDGSANLSGSTRIEIPSELSINTREELIEHVFGDFSQPFLGDAAILCPRNDTVNDINNILLDKIQGEERIYLSDTYIKQQGTAIQNFDDMTLTPEYLESLNPASLPFHRLRLKVGAVIMLMRNMNFDHGLCNGTKLIIVGLGNHALYCRGVEGDLLNEVIIIPRIILTTDEFRFDSLLCRKQFPVRLCMAMTINRSQGGTLKRVGIYLATPSFSHGQLYVGVSRVRSRSDLKILIEQTPLQGSMTHNDRTIKYTVNEVYDEIIQYVG